MAKRKASRLERQVIGDMTALGVYRPQFDASIGRYCQLREQYDAMYDRFVEGGMQYEVQTSGGAKKAPIMLVLESLRKDILAIEAQLGLTPAGLKRLNDDLLQGPKPKSRLESALGAME